MSTWLTSISPTTRSLRRTADAYDMFLGDTDRIRLSRDADGRLDVVNGRHRIIVARDLGIKHLPGTIRGA